MIWITGVRGLIDIIKYRSLFDGLKPCQPLWLLDLRHSRRDKTDGTKPHMYFTLIFISKIPVTRAALI